MRAERLVALQAVLQRRRTTTVAALADELGVSTRTLHRDLAALQAQGVPLWTAPGRGGGVGLVDGWRAPHDRLTGREAVSLLALRAPQGLAALGLGTAASAAGAKVAAGLPADLGEQARLVAQRFHLDAPGWFRPEDAPAHLAVLARAVWQQVRVQVRYGAGDRVLEPLGLVLKAGVWYLVARSGGQERTYRVARVADVEVRDEPFDRPADFDLQRWWAASSAAFARSLARVPVRLRLSPRGVRALPHLLGPDAAVELAPVADGDGWTAAQVGLESVAVAAGQLLGLGEDVEVLGPVEVRAALADLARSVAARHEAPPAP